MKRLSALATVSTLVAMMLPVANAGTAIAPSCRVTNGRSGIVTSGDGSNLQTAIDDARPGDVLRVRGVCEASKPGFLVDKALTLRGVPTAEYPTPALDGGGLRLMVLSVWSEGARVTVRDLSVRGGRLGGIDIDPSGILILLGSASVRNNRSPFLGGGIGSWGRLVIDDSVVVAGNRVGSGAGIANYGTAIVRGNALITRNSTTTWGGGIYNWGGKLILEDHALVKRNSAAWKGGGIYSEFGTVVLRGAAAVVRNKAGRAGGGVFGRESRIYVCSTSVRVSPNRPNDPPKTLPCS